MPVKILKVQPGYSLPTLKFSGQKLGSIEVFYTQEKPWAYEGPFLKEERNLLEGVSAVISVIIQQKLDEKKLRSDEERHRLFIENFKGINFQGDLNFNFEFLTGAVEDITGYKPDEFLEGKVNWLNLVYEDDKDIVLKSAAKMREVPNYFQEREYRLIKKNGQKVWIKEIIQNIVGSDGNPEYVKRNYN
ncbi:MAG: PAS domain-containing protein [Actinomycetota bacterium]|nr:PAS domain-containing protein [Actinomycetota bacterium]